MSAFIVGKKHIDLLVEAVFRYEVPLNDPMEPDALGHLLWHENFRSVNYRYSENEQTPPYRHDSTDVHELVRDPYFVHKQVRCYNYQTCERDDYGDSTACKIMESLEDALSKATGLEPGEMIKREEDHPWGIE